MMDYLAGSTEQKGLKEELFQIVFLIIFRSFKQQKPF